MSLAATSKLIRVLEREGPKIELRKRR